METIKYTIETLVDINIHEGLTKEQITSLKKEKDCLDAFEAISSFGDDYNSHRDVAETSRLDRLGELIDTLIKTGALNYAIRLCRQKCNIYPILTYTEKEINLRVSLKD